MLILFSGCIAKKNTSPKDEISTSTNPLLAQGKNLYQQKCTLCHAAKAPYDYTATQWKKIVPNMVIKANEKEELISKKDAEIILDYVIHLAKE